MLRGRKISDTVCCRITINREGRKNVLTRKRKCLTGCRRQKGEKGSPGELVGQIYYTPANEIGEITKNTKNGIFGRLDGLPDLLQEASAMEIGFKQEIKTGSAQILVTLEDTRQLYDIMISDVDLNPQEANKGIAFQVADDTLIQETGGIIQGMSGAPILQNGKVIGAVTHVFVDNPTKGYGIFIETMLEQGSDE